ncbi:PFL family protein [Candidatus Riflebacteria bacterium]
MDISLDEVLETVHALNLQNLDIRTVTLGLSLRDCCDSRIERVCINVYDKLMQWGSKILPTAVKLEKRYGVPIVNKRIAVTPIAHIGEATEALDYSPIAVSLEKAAINLGIDFIGGFSCFVEKGETRGDHILINSIPKALSETNRVCSSVNVASTRAGINMNSIRRLSDVILKTALLTRKKGGIGCAKLVVFANEPDDNPFMAGALHGYGEKEGVINIGISGPGVVLATLKGKSHLNLGEVAELIRQTSYKITRLGRLIGEEMAKELKLPFGIIDLSLAPTPAIGDSIGDILQAMGVEEAGAHGSTAALAILNDNVKKGGLMAYTYIGGLSGAFIPITEDMGMVRAVEKKALNIEKLEAMSSVCSVGLDMVAIPGDTPASTIAAIIADEAAIGVFNNKTTAVRLIPVPGKKAGERVDFGGLLGHGPIMSTSSFKSNSFTERGGQIPPPLQSFKN